MKLTAPHQQHTTAPHTSTATPTTVSPTPKTGTLLSRSGSNVDPSAKILRNLNVSMEGWLRKRSQGVANKVWHDRYFVLHGTTLVYYARRNDPKIRGIYHLASTCTVSNIYLSHHKKETSSDVTKYTNASVDDSTIVQGQQKNLYCFEITWREKISSSIYTEKHLSSIEAVDPPMNTISSLETTDIPKLTFVPSSTQMTTTRGHTVHESTTISDDIQLSSHSNKANTTDEIAKASSHSQGYSSNAKKKNHTLIPSRSYSALSAFRRRKFFKSSSDDKGIKDKTSTGTVTLSTKTPSVTIKEKDSSDIHDKSSDNVVNRKLFIPDLGGGGLDDQQLTLQDRSTTQNESLHKSSSSENSFSSQRLTSGINKHYSDQMNRRQLEAVFRHQERIKVAQMEQKKFKDQKRLNTYIRTGQYVAAAGAAVTIGVFTAGITWIVGIIFIAISATAAGSSVMVEMGKRRSNSTLVIASDNLEVLQEWKDTIDSIIAYLMEEDASMTQIGKDATNRTNSDSDVIMGADNDGIFDHNVMNMTTLPCSHSSRWEPLDGGWATLLGLGSLGMRIFREETDQTKSLGHTVSFKGALPRMRSMLRLGIQGRPCPPLKTQVILKASPLNAFMCLMTHMSYDEEVVSMRDDITLPFPNSGQRSSFRILETIDDNSDIIHLFFRPLYLFPFWILPRDFVLFRYWRFESNGTYTIMYDSIEHRNCPPIPGYVRGLMNGVYTIAPPRSRRGKNQLLNAASTTDECLLTHVVQVDPCGWISSLPLPLNSAQGYSEAFAVSVLALVLEVRDALDRDRFVPVPLDGCKPPAWNEAMSRFRKSVEAAEMQDQLRKNQLDPHQAPSTPSQDTSYHRSRSMDEEDDNNHDHRFSTIEVRGARSRTGSEGSVYSSEDAKSAQFCLDPPTYPFHHWAEPAANSFLVRGKSYKKDGIKVNAGDSLFPLLAVDLVRADSVLYTGLCAHPMERVQKALAREREAKALGLSASDMPVFIICVNIVLAGPPPVHMAFFYGVDDMSKIDGTNGTPSSKLANQFFFGPSDEFRDGTFKLIPRIADGNFLVRKAVGSTPAILGRKLKQTYIQGDRYFELIVDTGSSSVSAGVLRVCSSYSKFLVADMAFLLEGNDESFLPEKIFGCARVKNIDLSRNVRTLGDSSDTSHGEF